MDQSSVYRTVLDGLDDAVFVFDLENRLIFMNQAAKAISRARLNASYGNEFEKFEEYEEFEESEGLPGTCNDRILGGLDPEGRIEEALRCRERPGKGSLILGETAFEFSTSPLFDDGKLIGSSIFLKKPSDPVLPAKDSHSKPQSDLDRGNDVEIELRRRDTILAGAVLAINHLLIAGEKEAAINQALEVLGSTVDADRVYVFENITADEGERMHRLCYEWARDTVDSQMSNKEFHELSYESLPGWYETLSSGRPIRGLTRDLPEKHREFMQRLSVLSYLIVPVFVEERFWGLIGFDDCRAERAWTWCEASILLTMAGALGGALSRWQADQELRESEEKYRELVESSNSIIMRRDISGRITFFNEFAQKFFGYSQEEILGKSVIGTIVPPVDSSGRDLAAMIEAIGKYPERYASNFNENMRSNGERVWVAWTNRPLRNEAGETVEILCIGNDITERKKAEERLKQAHKHLLEIIEFLPDATFVVDRDKKVIAWNRALELMTGVSKETVLGRGNCIYGLPFYGQPRPMLIDLIDGDIDEILSDYFFVEEKDGKLYAEAFMPSLYGGCGAYIWATASPLYDDEGNLIGAIESIRDVTELKEASEELRKRDVLLAGVAAAANALLFTRDHEAEIGQALEILGLSADVDRVLIFQNHLSPGGDLLTSLKYEWCRNGISPQIGDSGLKDCPFERSLPSWHAALAAKEIISGLVKDFPPNERSILEPFGIVSLLAVPITVNGEHWGFISFDDCRQERSWSKTEISILRSAAGSIGATIEREEAVEELHETRDYLENLLDYANAPIIVWDPSFQITRFNHAFERLTGLKAGEVIGKPLEILFPEQSRSESLAYIRKTLMGERWDAVEIPILRKDGAVRTVLWNSATLYDKDGCTVVATIAQGQDITERNQAVEKINYQASLLDQVRNAVIATDMKGNIVYWNRHAEVLHQWTAEEVLGRNIAETTVREGMVDKMHKVMEKISREGFYETELQVRRKDGSIFPAYYIFSVIRDIHGQNIGFVGVSIDITERKRAEADLRQSIEKAQSATRAKSQFLANMSHEIRTPMNAIIGLTGLLLNTEMTAEQKDYIETIRSSGDSLLAIINDILDFSKIDEGKMDIECQPFDLVDCIEASLDLVAQSAARKALDLSYSVSPNVPQRIMGDVTRLRQVLVNLLSNAVKFTDRGSVSVAVSCQSSSCRSENPHYENPNCEILFAVSDTGIGISQDRMDRLFQTFSQVDASMTRKYGGTGLGLAISKRLVELMNGRIWAQSDPGMGSTFNFTIAAKAAPAQSLVELAGKSVLIISLAEVSRNGLCSQLRSWGMRPQLASSCRDALDRVARQTFDLAILDMDMTDAKSFMQEVSFHKAPPVIAFGSTEGVTASFAAVVSRPVRIPYLAEALVKSSKEESVQRAMPAKIDPSKIGARHTRILLAEDNAVNQKVAMRMLERLGYRADAVANGLEVLQALKRQAYDLILMDVQMPEMDGLDVTRRIRAMNAGCQPYIIAMTAHAMKGDREECIAAGMNDYVSKPVRMEELHLALVRSMGYVCDSTAIDRQALMNLRKLQMDGEPDIVQELGSMYLLRTPSRIAAMKDAMVRSDAEGLRREAHNLKSSSANLGALRLSYLCKDLEAFGRLGDLKGAQELMMQVESEFERVRQALESEISVISVHSA